MDTLISMIDMQLFWAMIIGGVLMGLLFGWICFKGDYSAGVILANFLIIFVVGKCEYSLGDACASDPHPGILPLGMITYLICKKFNNFLTRKKYQKMQKDKEQNQKRRLP